jgi:predicted kinase
MELIVSLEFCIGLPRSGKSTFSKRWKAEHKNGVVLSGDSFRLAIYDKRFQVVGEEFVRASIITATRALLLSGYDVLIDETNTSISNIKSILAIDKNAKAYFFKTDLETCINRARDCGFYDLIPSIYRMYNNLQLTLEALESGLLEIKHIEEVK